MHHPPLVSPVFVSAFHPVDTTGFRSGNPTPSTSPLLLTLFSRPPPVRNSWPPLLPPWNEVGMCKIVLRYALYHRVASSPPALFLPLAFFRPLLSPLYSPSSALSLEHVSSGYCQYLPLCSNFSHFSFPLDLPRAFLLDHLIPSFYVSSPCLSSSLLILTFLIFLRSFYFSLLYFSLVSFFLRISLSSAPTHFYFALLIYLCLFHFLQCLSSFYLSLEEYRLCIPLFWSK